MIGKSGRSTILPRTGTLKLSGTEVRWEFLWTTIFQRWPSSKVYSTLAPVKTSDFLSRKHRVFTPTFRRMTPETTTVYRNKCHIYAVLSFNIPKVFLVLSCLKVTYYLNCLSIWWKQGYIDFMKINFVHMQLLFHFNYCEVFESEKNGALVPFFFFLSFFRFRETLI